MYILRSFWTNKVGKTFESIWLRESYRESDGKVKHRNILNLKNWPEEAIELLQSSLNIKIPSSPARGRPHGSKNKNKQKNSSTIEAFYVRPEEILIMTIELFKLRWVRANASKNWTRPSLHSSQRQEKTIRHS